MTARSHIVRDRRQSTRRVAGRSSGAEPGVLFVIELLAMELAWVVVLAGGLLVVIR